METDGADGLALTEVALCYMPIRVSGLGLFAPSAWRPCYKLLSSGGRGSAEAAGCDLPDGFGDNLVVTHGHQDQGFGY